MLSNKVAVITGGGSGIGQGIARAFLEAGARVILFSRNEQRLIEAKAALGSVDVDVVVGDITKKTDVQRLYQQLGKVDIVVANAASSGRLPMTDMDEVTFDRIMNSALKGTYLTVQCALPHVNDGGAVLLIASVAAHRVIRHNIVYSGMKAAVVAFAQRMAFELADRNIRVNSISPGYIQTPIFSERLIKDPDFLNKRLQCIPLKRIGQPKDIADAAVFLCGDKATYITGADLVIDGGYSVCAME